MRVWKVMLLGSRTGATYVSSYSSSTGGGAASAALAASAAAASDGLAPLVPAASCSAPAASGPGGAEAVMNASTSNASKSSCPSSPALDARALALMSRILLAIDAKGRRLKLLCSPCWLRISCAIATQTPWYSFSLTHASRSVNGGNCRALSVFECLARNSSELRHSRSTLISASVHRLGGAFALPLARRFTPGGIEGRC